MSAQIYFMIFLIISVIVVTISYSLTFYNKRKEFSEKIKLDVTTDQMRESEKRIKDFLTKNNIEPKQSILEIAKVLNVEEGGIDPDLQSQAYLKERDKTGKKIVVFKTGLSEEQRLFVFAHELAHLLNGDSVPVNRPNGRNKAYIEQLADYTAAALLMPMDEVYTYLKNQNYTGVSDRKRMSIVHDLCKNYNVTEMIAMRRIKEIRALKKF